MMMAKAAPRALPASARRNLNVLLIAKHVHWHSGLHPSDGSHAVYHREMRTTLDQIGVNLHLADSYEALFGAPRVDFVFPLLNRGGFLNSEMLLPLLCERLGLPYLGASPILRGLSDDKHLSKRAAVARGLPTASWAIYRQGTAIDPAAAPRADRYVIKPNASSASWGISAADDWAGVRDAVARLHEDGHDAIVEPFIPGHDVEVPVVTLHGRPFILPIQIVEQEDPHYLRTYQEKRNLVGGQAYEIRPLSDPRIRAEAGRMALALMPEFMPFDYGRFEFRLDIATGEVRFMEVNLNCNLWSKKTIALAARQIGWSHAELIETILTESLDRHGLIDGALARAAA
jgi:D-alanine-D-alanine ligase